MHVLESRVMQSSFTWLDYSEQDRRKMVDVVSAFREQDTRDELGIGRIRDGFADLLSHLLLKAGPGDERGKRMSTHARSIHPDLQISPHWIWPEFWGHVQAQLKANRYRGCPSGKRALFHFPRRIPGGVARSCAATITVPQPAAQR
jgi:hypothetical protein